MFTFLVYIYLLCFFPNRSKPGICAELTGTNKQVWESNLIACEEYLRDYVTSYAIKLILILVFIWGNLIFCLLFMKECCLKPMLVSVQSIFHPKINKNGN